jgi:hypothetical protein
METNDTLTQPAAAEPQLILTQEAQYYLQKAGQWANFIGIIGFIVTGLIVLGALFVGTMFSMMASLNPLVAYPTWIGTAMTIFYLFFAVFNFFFSLYIYQFGDRAKKGILHNNVQEITIAFGKLKSFFKLWGIATIVIIALYILAFIFAIIASVGAASMMGR